MQIGVGPVNSRDQQVLPVGGWIGSEKNARLSFGFGAPAAGVDNN